MNDLVRFQIDLQGDDGDDEDEDDEPDEEEEEVQIREERLDEGEEEEEEEEEEEQEIPEFVAREAAVRTASMQQQRQKPRLEAIVARTAAKQNARKGKTEYYNEDLVCIVQLLEVAAISQRVKFWADVTSGQPAYY